MDATKSIAQNMRQQVIERGSVNYEIAVRRVDSVWVRLMRRGNHYSVTMDAFGDDHDATAEKMQEWITALGAPEGTDIQNLDDGSFYACWTEHTLA